MQGYRAAGICFAHASPRCTIARTPPSPRMNRNSWPQSCVHRVSMHARACVRSFPGSNPDGDVQIQRSFGEAGSTQCSPADDRPEPCAGAHREAWQVTGQLRARVTPRRPEGAHWKPHQERRSGGPGNGALCGNANTFFAPAGAWGAWSTEGQNVNVPGPWGLVGP